jgi:hypothetical protein
MGDRTYVTLSIPSELDDLAKELINKSGPDEVYHEDDFVNYAFCEVNYAVLACEDSLIAHGIPFDKVWDAGSSYGSGTEYLRFTPEGKVQCLEIYDSDLGVNRELLLDAIDDHPRLKEIILTHHQKTTPLSWDNQVTYGKLYRTLMLITGNNPP